MLDIFSNFRFNELYINDYSTNPDLLKEIINKIAQNKKIKKIYHQSSYEGFPNVETQVLTNTKYLIFNKGGEEWESVSEFWTLELLDVLKFASQLKRRFL